MREEKELLVREEKELLALYISSETKIFYQRLVAKAEGLLPLPEARAFTAQAVLDTLNEEGPDLWTE